MENKKYVLIARFRYVFLLVLFLMGSNVLQALNPNTPESVRTFYDGMQKLSTVSDVNDAYELSRKMKECFHGYDEKNVSGIDLPNDFKLFGFDKKNISHNDSQLSSSTYVDRLNDYLYSDKVMKIHCKYLQTSLAGELPEFKNKGLVFSEYLLETLVKKTYVLNGVKKVFMDTVLTDLMSKKICEIRNGFGADIIDIKSLRIKAALAYHRKHYEEAYKCYEQILEIDAKNGDALYRIGLMTYYQQGCNFSQKSKARKKGIKYMEMATFCNDYSIRYKADNVLHNWKYPRI